MYSLMSYFSLSKRIPGAVAVLTGLGMGMVASCGVSEPGELSVRVTSRSRMGQSPVDEVVVAESYRSSILISGSFFSPTDCGAIDGRLNRHGTALVVRLEPNRHGCGGSNPLSTSFLRYDALIFELSPGTYSLRVIHDNRHTFGLNEAVRLAQTIAVP